MLEFKKLNINDNFIQSLERTADLFEYLINSLIKDEIKKIMDIELYEYFLRFMRSELEKVYFTYQIYNTNIYSAFYFDVIFSASYDTETNSLNMYGTYLIPLTPQDKSFSERYRNYILDKFSSNPKIPELLDKLFKMGDASCGIYFTKDEIGYLSILNINELIFYKLYSFLVPIIDTYFNIYDKNKISGMYLGLVFDCLKSIGSDVIEEVNEVVFGVNIKGGILEKYNFNFLNINVDNIEDKIINYYEIINELLLKYFRNKIEKYVYLLYELKFLYDIRTYKIPGSYFMRYNKFNIFKYVEFDSELFEESIFGFNKFVEKVIDLISFITAMKLSNIAALPNPYTKLVIKNNKLEIYDIIEYKDIFYPVFKKSLEFKDYKELIKYVINMVVFSDML